MMRPHEAAPTLAGRARARPPREQPDSAFLHLASADAAAPARLLDLVKTAGVAHELREHEPARHARHLASLWGAALPEAGRATLFYADGRGVLVVVPADRKVSAPLLREVLGAGELRVLRGDRGVGRLGWHNLDGLAGALPAVPALYGAPLYVDERVMALPRLIVALTTTRSVALAPDDYVRITGGTVARFTGATRLLPEGGMVRESSTEAEKEEAAQ
jgi:prolyl-tRNA editing enzyme YbaK/EbsC (Cys-tRNA(Pro) deacylase)